MILSGNKVARPAADASQIPRSVSKPVTRRAGVTSKAGFFTGDPSGIILISLNVPEGLRPQMCVTSRSGLSSMGILAMPFFP